MTDKKLIELVRANEELYDLSHPGYPDVNLKEKIWKRIGEELKLPSNLCKTRWNNIRDNYRKSRKKALVFVNGQLKIRRYKYGDMLTFLNNNFKERDHSSNIAAGDTLAEEVGVGALTKDFETTAEDVLTRNEDVEDRSLGHQPIKRPRSSVMFPETPKEERKTEVSSLVKYILEEKSAVQTESSQVHPVDAFLASIAPTLKTLTPYHLNIAKSKIFAIVQQYELEMILEQQKQLTVSVPPCRSLPSTSSQPAAPFTALI